MMHEINKKLSLKDRVAVLLGKFVPTAARTFLSASPLAEGSYVANTMTVDKLQAILRSAESGDCTELFDLYRDIIAVDSHMQAEFGKRKMSVLLEIISAQPADENNPDDVRAAGLVQDMLDSIPDRMRVLSHMMDSTLWPLSVVEKVFKKSSKPGLAYEISRIVPVPHRLIDLRDGSVRIYNVDDSGRNLTDSEFADPARYIVHRGHILTTPDYWGGPMRSLLFWWLFSVMDIGWWAGFLEKFGTPFMIGKYDRNDTTSRGVLERAFSTVRRLGGLVITKETQVEIQNALSSQNGDAYDKFLSICAREKSKLILGQTLSAEAQPTGLGSGVSNAHEAVRNDIKLFDAQMLATTLRNELVVPYMRYNGIRGDVPHIVIGGEDEEDMKGLAEVLQALNGAGIRPSDDAIGILSQRIGFTLERIETPFPFSATTAFSADTPKNKKTSGIDAAMEIAGTTAADIAREYGGSLAAVQKLLVDSTSPKGFETDLKKFCAGWPPEKVTMLVQEALNSNVINGATPKKR